MHGAKVKIVNCIKFGIWQLLAIQLSRCEFRKNRCTERNTVLSSVQKSLFVFSTFFIRFGYNLLGCRPHLPSATEFRESHALLMGVGELLYVLFTFRAPTGRHSVYEICKSCCWVFWVLCKWCR